MTILKSVAFVTLITLAVFGVAYFIFDNLPRTGSEVRSESNASSTAGTTSNTSTNTSGAVKRGGACGDGICDGPETATLCPSDCSQ